MQLTSVYFIVFMAFAILGFQCCSSRYRYLFILLCNILFYTGWINDIKSAFSLAAVIIVTWAGALLYHKTRYRFILHVCLAASFLFLVWFKYADFMTAALDKILRYSGHSGPIPLSPMAPIGISFFTFQAAGYLIDVYRGKTMPEKNLFRYAAFVSFFPTITSGPIERSDHLLKQLREVRPRPSFDDVRRGFILFVYGAFVKLVISERLALLVSSVMDYYHFYSGIVCFIAAVCYSVQIYCDFSSYSLMAAGAAKCFGFDIVENFTVPYFSETLQEFWRRWHISLSTWFRDYVYIPLGGNRCSGLRKNINLLITFLVSGLWHGANWTFVFWGFLHGFYQVVGNLTRKGRNKALQLLRVNTECFSYHLFRKLIVFLLVTFAWIFFRFDTITEAFSYIWRIFGHVRLWEIFDGTVYEMGLDYMELAVLFFSLSVLILADVLKYKTRKNIDCLLLEQNILFHCLVVALLITVTMVYGLYGPGFDAREFIYIRF
ncbi:MAG: MBOAT family protein [Blautia sp.]|nr:MBOAT family protein [Blautia sp.]